MMLFVLLPALFEAAPSTFEKNNCDGQLVLISGAGTRLTVLFENGDIKVGPLKRKLRGTAAAVTRGRRSTVRHTNERIFPSISFSARVGSLTASSTGTVADAVLRNGAWSAEQSTLGANADVYTLDAEVTIEGTAYGDSADAQFTCEDVEFQLDEWSEGEWDQFAISGVIYGPITGDLACSEDGT